MSQSPQPQQPQQPQQPIALFDPKTITVGDYSGKMVGVLVIWCFGGIILSMMGTTITDWTGALLTVVEALFLVARDRQNFYTGAGFWKVGEWSSAQRTLLAVLEVPFWAIALMLYVVRLAALHYQQLQQPAPLTPPAKRKRPQR